ncbi:MAG: FtsX-like permease family protein [Candidatus Margulisiibacteriota bacterium]
MFGLAVKNILNTFRGVATLFGFSIMVAAAILSWSLVREVSDGALSNIAYYRSGHLRVVDKQFNDQLLPLNKAFAKYQEVEKIAAQYPGVKAQAERIEARLLLQHLGRSAQARGIAIDAIREHPPWRTLAGRQVGISDKELVIGAKLAQKLAVGLDDTLTIVTPNALGSLTVFDLKVVGIFSSGSTNIDESYFFFPLAAAQNVFDLKGKVSEVVVYLRDPRLAREGAEFINAELARVAPGQFKVIPWERDDAVVWLEKGELIGWLVGGLCFFIGCALIYHFFSAGVAARDPEIAALKRLGVKKGEMVRLLIIEATILGLLAGAIGGLIAFVLAQLLSGQQITISWLDLQFVRAELEVALRLPDILKGVAGSLLFSWLAMALPAWRGVK